MNEVLLIRNLTSFVANEVAFITNPTSFVANELMFSMDEVAFITNPTSFVTNEIRFSMNEVAFITNPTSFVTNEVVFSMEDTRKGVFEEEAGRTLLEDGIINLVTFDAAKEIIVQWIQHDGTEEGIALELELVAAGIPKEHIILAFKSIERRKLTEFAVS